MQIPAKWIWMLAAALKFILDISTTKPPKDVKVLSSPDVMATLTTTSLK